VFAKISAGGQGEKPILLAVHRFWAANSERIARYERVGIAAAPVLAGLGVLGRLRPSAYVGLEYWLGSPTATDFCSAGASSSSPSTARRTPR